MVHQAMCSAAHAEQPVEPVGASPCRFELKQAASVFVFNFSGVCKC